MRAGRPVEVLVGGSAHQARWLGVYGEVSDGELLLHVDSAGLMALAVRGGSASDELGIGEGTAVTLQRPG